MKKKVDIEKILKLRKEGKGFKAIGKELGLNYQLVRRRVKGVKGLQNTPIKTES